MKKLKVILPAILTLAVSTSAAVTGTVAWFTASRLRTVEMGGIAVVNPESGLNITVTEGANTKVEGDQESGFTVTHGKRNNGDNPATYTDVYLRDASVNMATPTVYRADVDEEGEVVSYAIPTDTTNFNDENGKTYNGKPVVYATTFTASFTCTNNPGDDDAFSYGLFLDLKNSSVTGASQYAKDSATINADKDAKLLQALRIGFKAGDEWFVWAPLSTEGVRTGADASHYDIKYLDGTAKGTNEKTFDEANLVIGGNTNTSGDELVSDSNNPIANATATAYKGYLGTLDKTTPINVSVYTWFDGLDKYCENDYFTNVLKETISDLQFVMRRVADPIVTP